MWTRPPGPPKIWKVVEAVDAAGKTRKFSLQEIPEAGYDEAVQHMCSIFARDEILFSNLNAADEPASMDLCATTWKLILQQGISVGAFEVLGDGEEPVLAGVNVLIYADAETDKALKNIEPNASRAEKLIKFAVETCEKVDPCKLYGVDRYLGAFGLSVDPKYRRLGLGRLLLELRGEIGKTYDISYTSTMFTSKVSQRTAEGAGFHTDLELSYEKAVDADGSLLFPRLKTMSCKVMGKKLC